MKHLGRTSLYILVAAGLLFSAHRAVARNSIPSPGAVGNDGVLQSAVGSITAHASREPVELLDGVVAETMITIGPAFTLVGESEQMRCVSYVVMFRDSNRTSLGHVFGQENCLVNSSESLEIGCPSIFPFLRSQAAVEGPTGPAPQHLYAAYIYPENGKMWGEVEEFQIRGDLMRLE